MHSQNTTWSAVAGTASGASVGPAAGEGELHGRTRPGHSRTTPLRVDAQRNLEHVLRAAREVFGELGYGAPMEDVARRARVGVGTVYRRFPSKDVLVRRIAAEETSRLTDQARTALGQEDEPWSALARFLRTSVASGAGRLLPPQVLIDSGRDVTPRPTVGSLVPQQRRTDAPLNAPELRLVDHGHSRAGSRQGYGSTQADAAASAQEDAGTQELLDVVGRLVERAREAGELRQDVTVSDVLLVIATSAPAVPDPAQQTAASARVLEILLAGLRTDGARNESSRTEGAQAERARTHEVRAGERA